MNATPDAKELNDLFALFGEGRHALLESRTLALVERHPQSGLLWKILGVALAAQGKDALAALRRAAELLPDDPEAQENLAKVQALRRAQADQLNRSALARQAGGDLGGADEHLRQALAIYPEHVETLNNLGNLLRLQGRGEDALTCYRRAVQLAPDIAELHANLGELLHDLGQLDEAAASHRRAIALKPQAPGSHIGLGIVLYRLGYLADAGECFRRAVELAPDSADAHLNLGNVLREQGQIGKALDCYRQALAIRADFPEAWSNLGIAQSEDGQAAVAVESFQYALALRPDFAEARLNLGLCRLKLGDYRAGWADYEFRRRNAPPGVLALAQWRGEPAGTNQRLLVWEEQGYGDRLQFLRYLRLAAGRFPAGVTCVIGDALYGLAQRSFPEIEFRSDFPSDLSAWHRQCPLLSLPLAFATTLDNIPAAVPYLVPDEVRVAGWRERIAALGCTPDTLKVGVAWQSGKAMRNAARRSLAAAELAPLLDVPGTLWFCLNKEDDPARREWLAKGRLVDWSAEFADFDASAALAINLDLIVSVDTALVHLAGGLGLPTWLFNRHGSEWRWLLGREDSPWYPTLRIFNQLQPGSWGETVERMTERLADEVRRKRAVQPSENPLDAQEGTMQRLAALFQAQRYAELESWARNAGDADPANPLAWKILAVALQMQGKDALPALRRAVELAPHDADLHNNLGVALKRAGQYAEALPCFLRALEIHPLDADLHVNLGNTLSPLGRYGEAERALRRALQIAPQRADAHNQLAAVLHGQGQRDAALESCRTALALNPDYPEAHLNMGNILHAADRLHEAAACYRSALAIRPDYPEGYNNLGNTLQELGRWDEAAHAYRQALAIRGNYLDAHSNLLYVETFRGVLEPAELLAEARRFGENATCGATPMRAWRVTREKGRRLRVGLVSGDLWAHPVGYFLVGVLEAQHGDPTAQLEFVAYANQLRDDALSARIRACCADWVPVRNLSDEALARRIHDDSIDILIDLAGHTANNRLPVFAWKAAPVQATWLGYWATTGLAAIDYLLADPYCLPESEAAMYSESIRRLPDTRLCFTPPTADVAVSPLPAREKGYLVFASFNNLAKASDGVLTLWARLLAMKPDSRLLLKSRQFADPAERQRIEAHFAAQGIAGERLILAGQSPYRDYLATYREVDVVLDTFPYPGGTTTVEALWMGVPVLTLAGTSMLSRQGAAILANLGLNEWIARDGKDYLRRALQLSADLDCLAALRLSLRERVRRSPVCDVSRFAHHFAAALRGMWDNWCDGTQPDD